MNSRRMNANDAKFASISARGSYELRFRCETLGNLMVYDASLDFEQREGLWSFFDRSDVVNDWTGYDWIIGAVQGLNI